MNDMARAESVMGCVAQVKPVICNLAACYARNYLEYFDAQGSLGMPRLSRNS